MRSRSRSSRRRRCSTDPPRPSPARPRCTPRRPTATSSTRCARAGAATPRRCWTRPTSSCATGCAMQRHAAIPLETRGLLAEVDPDSGRLTVWGPTKVKHFNRTLLAGFLDLPEDAVRFVEPDVGGGFGARGEFYPEDFLVPWLAVGAGRPVKWVEDRHEHFVALNHSRETWCDFEIGADRGRPPARLPRRLPGRPGRLRAHPWHACSCPGCSCTTWPGPTCGSGFAIEARQRADQQDAVGHLPRPRPVRGRVRPRAHGRPPGQGAGRRPGRAARAATSSPSTPCPIAWSSPTSPRP